HEVIKRIVATMRVREEAEGKEFGVIVIAEGLAELLPYQHIEGVPRDEHGHIVIAQLSLGKLFSELVGKEYHKQTVKKRLDGVMVSIRGQLELNYVRFDQLVDPATLVTVVRYIEPGSDFHRLARFLETYVND